LRARRRSEPKAVPSAKSYSLFGLTRGASVAVRSSIGLEEEDEVFSSPELTRRIALIFLLVFNVTLVLSLFFNAPLEEAANPGVTPNPAKAPWYFLWLQELVASTTIRLGSLQISGGFIGGILIPGALLLLAALWPFLDRSPETTQGRWFPRERLWQNAAFAAVAVLIVALIAVGVFLRGPYWHLYWPGTPWPEMPRAL
jgi:quinol-cytochrome oxidoreductase complex cytochrome b subunit